MHPQKEPLWSLWVGLRVSRLIGVETGEKVDENLYLQLSAFEVGSIALIVLV